MSLPVWLTHLSQIVGMGMCLALILGVPVAVTAGLKDTPGYWLCAPSVLISACTVVMFPLLERMGRWVGFGETDPRTPIARVWAA